MRRHRKKRTVTKYNLRQFKDPNQIVVKPCKVQLRPLSDCWLGWGQFATGPGGDQRKSSLDQDMDKTDPVADSESGIGETSTASRIDDLNDSLDELILSTSDSDSEDGNSSVEILSSESEMPPPLRVWRIKREIKTEAELPGDDPTGTNEGCFNFKLLRRVMVESDQDERNLDKKSTLDNKGPCKDPTSEEQNKGMDNLDNNCEKGKSDSPIPELDCSEPLENSVNVITLHRINESEVGSDLDDHENEEVPACNTATEVDKSISEVECDSDQNSLPIPSDILVSSNPRVVYDLSSGKESESDISTDGENSYADLRLESSEDEIVSPDSTNKPLLEQSVICEEDQTYDKVIECSPTLLRPSTVEPEQSGDWDVIMIDREVPEVSPTIGREPAEKHARADGNARIPDVEDEIPILVVRQETNQSSDHQTQPQVIRLDADVSTEGVAVVRQELTHSRNPTGPQIIRLDAPDPIRPLVRQQPIHSRDPTGPQIIRLDAPDAERMDLDVPESPSPEVVQLDESLDTDCQVLGERMYQSSPPPLISNRSLIASTRFQFIESHSVERTQWVNYPRNVDPDYDEIVEVAPSSSSVSVLGFSHPSPGVDYRIPNHGSKTYDVNLSKRSTSTSKTYNVNLPKRPPELPTYNRMGPHTASAMSSPGPQRQPYSYYEEETSDNEVIEIDDIIDLG
eukprot:GFUD01044923.1.p1 GENE.GFUD01044923.1~~GFUD01044923.1.p1  ORF type:complete len:683 (+),score=154.28 GFUD01044923.1:97-2145(+)